MTFDVELDREADGRWIAEVPALPGVLAYGATRDAALAAVETLALRVLADRIEHGEMAPGRLELTVPAAA
jgi:predicted RNase H-like HicB family nuclease